MVEETYGGGDAPAVPTIAELLNEYRRVTGASYDDMSVAVQGEITSARLHQLATEPPLSFPRNARTVLRLADLLQVPEPTLLDGYAAALGLPVTRSESLLSITLPPGTDILVPADIAAIRAIVRQLVQARSQPAPTPDADTMEGLRLAEDEDASQESHSRNGTVR